MPCSRWSHFMTPVCSDTRSGESEILMLGGANLKSFCRTTIWNFSLHNHKNFSNADC